MSGALEIEIEFTVWYDADGGVWIAESETPPYGIVVDGATREEVAAKIDLLAPDLVEAIHGRPPDRLTITAHWCSDLLQAGTDLAALVDA